MASDTPQIFFSYASEDKYWVEAFRKSVAFENVGAARVLDYAAEDVGFGDLREKLDERIERSAVIIAFVSADYLKKQWTVAEWESALTEAQRRRLVFVPIMLDADAVVWWKERRQQGGLTGLSRDYAYVSFIDAGGMRLDISPTDTVVNGKIARLAIQIRQDLESPLPATTDLDSTVSSSPSIAGIENRIKEEKMDVRSKSMASIFVSHAGEDRQTAMQIVRTLEARGVPCWIAPRNIRPGTDYNQAIVDAIDACWAISSGCGASCTSISPTTEPGETIASSPTPF